jgi:pimeloyl-ACP methyl ester carboxylesterase
MREEFLDSMAQVDKPSYLHLLRAISRFDLGERIGSCEVPTLVLCGDQDYTPVAFKQAWAAQMPNASVCVIPHSRHATPLDQPELCNQEIRRFLLGQMPAESPGQLQTS